MNNSFINCIQRSLQWTLCIRYLTVHWVYTSFSGTQLDFKIYHNLPFTQGVDTRPNRPKWLGTVTEQNFTILFAATVTVNCLKVDPKHNYFKVFFNAWSKYHSNTLVYHFFITYKHYLKVHCCAHDLHSSLYLFFQMTLQERIAIIVLEDLQTINLLAVMSLVQCALCAL